MFNSASMQAGVELHLFAQGNSTVNPCEYFYVLYPSPIVCSLTSNISIMCISMHLQTEWITLLILKPAGLDLQCFQKMDESSFSRTRVQL